MRPCGHPSSALRECIEHQPIALEETALSKPSERLLACVSLLEVPLVGQLLENIVHVFDREGKELERELQSVTQNS
jgi:hypothetical protein